MNEFSKVKADRVKNEISESLTGLDNEMGIFIVNLR